MAKPPLRVPVASVREGTSELASEAAHYVRKVHRLGIGAELELFDPERGDYAKATIESASKQAVVVSVGAVTTEPMPSPALYVAQAAATGDKLSQVLRDAVELGATSFVVVHAQRSTKIPGAGLVDRLRKVAIEAARQCGRRTIPKLLGPCDLESALNGAHDLPIWALDPRGPIPVADAAKRLSTTAGIALFVGPEGGFEAGELAQLESAGAERVRLGRYVLRTETASTAAIGAVLTRRES